MSGQSQCQQDQQDRGGHDQRDPRERVEEPMPRRITAKQVVPGLHVNDNVGSAQSEEADPLGSEAMQQSARAKVEWR